MKTVIFFLLMALSVSTAIALFSIFQNLSTLDVINDQSERVDNIVDRIEACENIKMNQATTIDKLRDSVSFYKRLSQTTLASVPDTIFVPCEGGYHWTCDLKNDPLGLFKKVGYFQAVYQIKLEKCNEAKSIRPF